jgi:hypothetical protein
MPIITVRRKRCIFFDGNQSEAIYARLTWRLHAQ